MSESNPYFSTKHGKTFIGLVIFSSSTLLTIILVTWLVATTGLDNLHPIASTVFTVLIFCCAILIFWAALGTVLSLYSNRFFLLAGRPTHWLVIKIMLPFICLAGRLAGIPQEKTLRSFIDLNNEFLQRSPPKCQAKEILILLPQCIQNSECKYKLTYDIHNCALCGHCPVKEILELSDRYGVLSAIASGGTLARQIVVRHRPKAIIAIACERDLATGISDVYPIPAYGILNECPHGPCLNTLVSLLLIEQALKLLLPGEPA